MREKTAMTNAKSLRILVIAALLIGLAGCSQAPGRGANQAGDETGDRIRVVTTINILGDFIRKVGGDRVEVFSILPAGGDPHLYQPVPADLITISRGDAVFYNGLTLELWLEELIENAGGERRTTMLTEDLVPLYQERGAWAGHPDPHMWMDPALAVQYVTNIRDALTELDPPGEAEYAENAASYIRELEGLGSWMQSELEQGPPGCRKLVTTHDAYRYFGKAFGFDIIGTIWGISTDEEPSAKEIAALVGQIRDAGVPAVFIETTVNPKLLQQAADEADARVGGTLYGDSLGTPGTGADDYIGMMRHNTRSIVSGLAEGCAP